MSAASSMFKFVKWTVLIVIGFVVTAILILFIYSEYVKYMARSVKSDAYVVTAETDWLMGNDYYDFYDNGNFVRLSTGPFGDTYQVGSYIIYEDTLVMTGYKIDEDGTEPEAYIISDSCRWLVEAEKMNGVWVEKMNGYSSSIYDCNLHEH